MTFDPFGDFATRGYLRNLANEKDLDIVRRLEHSSFATGLDEAFQQLSKVKHLSYDDVLATHRTLFDAYGHPFLDGNGRTIMVVHSVLAQRAGFSIDWAATSKPDYLAALTNEIDAPGKRYLDAYLKPFKREAVAYDRLATELTRAPGLDGNPRAELNRVLGKTNDPDVKAQYEQLQSKRKRTGD